MARPETAQVLHRIRWPLRLTWAGLWAERLSRAFWPLWSILLAVLAAAALGLVDLLPLEAAWMALVSACVGAVWALWHGWRGFAPPRRSDALARLDAALPGQPLSALADDQAIGGNDPASVAVWQAHRARMAARAASARPVQPDLKLAPRDPFGLRYMALTALVVALIFGSVWRIASLADLGPGRAEAMMAGPSWEGWARPPAHTGKPALYLNDLPAGPLTLPQGSEIQLRFYGDIGALTLSETVSASTQPQQASAQIQAFSVAQSGAIAIVGPGGREWQVSALPDAAPSVAITGEATRERDGKMRLPFRAEDDHGIKAGLATVTLDLDRVDRRFGLSIEPEPRAPLTLDLPLPISGNRAVFEDALVEDISQHPFANLPVKVRLTVEDAAGQSGASDALQMTLPGKRFFDPLAAAIIELRRDLLWNRANGPRTAQVFRALTHLPDGLVRDKATFARLTEALKTLYRDADTLTPEARDALAAELWEIALLVEEGDLASARDRLQRAQERLNEAIRNGADPAEIAELMDELREATKDYMQMLADREARNPDSDRAENQERMEVTGDQIQDMMDEIQHLMEEGRMAEAAEAMAMLQQLLENLQITEGGPGSGGPTLPGMRDLQDTLRDQQELSDEAFRELQQGQGGRQPQDGDAQDGQGDRRSLAERQEELRRRLEGVDTNRLPGPGTESGEEGREALEGAERSMEEAERALRDGDLSGALDRQAEAMEALRDGLKALGDAQRQNDRADRGQANTPEGTAPADPSRDPLGRENGRSARIGDDGNLGKGQDVQRRAQELLDEIRRRSGDQQRAEGERDYLRRLLDLF
ncbi:DUF4175 domain-containing protein [Gemmobacter denitrificans]|uniref:DUF4175 family protein n=1 Tax=Gemmobacter denitrificans TaxID=3123040 RepID=A0ABU8BTY5_9RHOB